MLRKLSRADLDVHDRDRVRCAGFARAGSIESASSRRLSEPGAVRTRVALDGGLVDVCTGTGKQRNLREYLDRTAILGRDPRGGAMALLFAVEMAESQLQPKKP
jgi:hypothetical protein